MNFQRIWNDKKAQLLDVW